MKLKSKIARYLLLLNSFLMVLYGMAVGIQPELFSKNLEIYSGVSLSKLSKSQPELTSYMDMVFQLNGAFNGLLGAVGLIAVYFSFKVKARWLLLIIFISNILGYLAPMTFDQITGVIRYPEVIEIVSFTLSLIAFFVIAPEFRNAT